MFGRAEARPSNANTFPCKGRGSNAYTSKGTPMRYIRSTFAPEDGRCMCLFEARNAEDVKRLNDEAKLPYTRVVEALDLTP